MLLRGLSPGMWKQTLQGKAEKQSDVGIQLGSVAWDQNSDLWVISLRERNNLEFCSIKPSALKRPVHAAQTWICEEQNIKNIKLVSGGCIFPVAYNCIGPIQLRPIQLWHAHCLCPARMEKPYSSQCALAAPVRLVVFLLKALSKWFCRRGASPLFTVDCTPSICF